MRGKLVASYMFLVLVGQRANANLCEDVQRPEPTQEILDPALPTAPAVTVRDRELYELMFTDTALRGDQRWNEIILQCNRKRDGLGNEVAKTTGSTEQTALKTKLQKPDLPAKIIRGHYNFFGVATGLFKYVYVLSKVKNVWTMVIPYNAVINELVPNRVDFEMGLREIIDAKANTIGDSNKEGAAWKLYEASELIQPAKGADRLPLVLKLKVNAQPIAVTLCSTSTFFPGMETKYDGQNDAKAGKRDHENKFISLGRIQFVWAGWNHVAEGCRVDENLDLYFELDGKVVKTKPQDYIFDNFVRVAESYWSTSNFKLRLLLKGRNDSSFTAETTASLQASDHLTVRFATKFMPYGGNQMYKSNPLQFNNFSTMTDDLTHRHEVGHAFGLDDEYGKEYEKRGTFGKNSCEHPDYASASTPTNYVMCKVVKGAKVKSIYQYVAVSRYITKQNICFDDDDCADGQYCDKGTMTIGKNQCLPKKADNQSCDLVGGAHQCISGFCKLSRCYTPNSVAMGGTCFNDDSCAVGKCSAIDGAKGTCVCKADSECSTGQWCDAGADFTKNQCRALKNDGEACAVVGGAHQCKGNHCSWGRCYTPGATAIGGTCYVDAACAGGKCRSIDGTKGTCVCKTDSDCRSGQWCDAGLDLKLNTCKNKLANGASCGTVGSVGNDHKCASGECSGFPNYKCK